MSGFFRFTRYLVRTALGSVRRASAAADPHVHWNRITRSWVHRQAE